MIKIVPIDPRTQSNHTRSMSSDHSTNYSKCRRVVVLLVAVSFATVIHQLHAQQVENQPLYFYTSVGDNLWVPTHLQTDSEESIDALIERFAESYGITGIYWRDIGFFVNTFRLGRETAQVHDWIKWCQHLSKDNALSSAAIRSAKKHGVKIFLHVGLFEAGVQPDIGVIAPHLFEDPLRIEHPEWLSVDRWGELRCPGRIAFCYPKARKALIDRLVRHITTCGYDGVNFYTYVENHGASYFEQFGYNQPIIDEFQRRYPNVNPRTTILEGEQKEYLARCRGSFLTMFLKELRVELAATGKTLSVQLESGNPHLVSPWPPKPFPVIGNVYVDYDKWIKEEIVDELCLTMGSSKVQEWLLEDLLERYGNSKVKFAFKTSHPFLSRWRKYIKQGAVPAVKRCYATSKYVRYQLGPGMLFSDNWMDRAQVLKNISQKKLPFKKEYLPKMRTLAVDRAVLVRREAILALAATGLPECIPDIEQGLLDPQPSVRIAAALALKSLNGDATPTAIFNALEKNHYFQFKNACVTALGTMSSPKQTAIICKTLENSQGPLKEVAIRSTRYLSPHLPMDRVLPLLCRTALDHQESELLRFYVIRVLSVIKRTLGGKLSNTQNQDVIETFLAIIEDESVSNTALFQSLRYASYWTDTMSEDQRKRLFQRLSSLFRQYGDKSVREDAAYGWRVVGNAMLSFGKDATVELNRHLAQKEDKWLAWLAYRMLYDRLGYSWKAHLITEAEAIKRHQFAPKFPGYRTWDNGVQR